MKRTLKTLCITLFFSISMLAQTGTDSVDLSKMVKQQINEVQAEKAQPKSSGYTAGQTINSSVLPENVFIVLFALAEIIAGGLIIRYYFRKRKLAEVEAKPILPQRENRDPKRKMTKAEVAKLRGEVVCQLALIKTQEELNRQAKKMNVGAGELELAIRLQNMAGSN